MTKGDSMTREDRWTKTIKDKLEKELNNNYEVTCFEWVPYSISIGNYEIEEEKENKKSIFLTNKQSFKVDLLIKEKRGNYSVPRLIIESKYQSVDTHNLIAYSEKARKHKEICCGLRYGLMVGNSNFKKGITSKILTHGENFDFIFLFKDDKQEDINEWEEFVKIVKNNLNYANEIENIITNKNNKKFHCMRKDIYFD